MVAEAPIWIAINGTRRIVLSCSPHEIDVLALGHLAAEGWIRTAADVLALQVRDGPAGARGVDVRLAAAPAAAALALLAHRTEHGCGLRHFLDCEPAGSVATAERAPPPADPVPLLRALFAAAAAAAPGGGVHTAALSDGAALCHTATDVARHCAVDRVVGLALRAGDDVSRFGLVLSSRVSGAIALKLVHTGIGWLASRSIATSLARELASAHRIALLQRAARREPGS